MKNKLINILKDEHLGEILRGTGIVFILRIIASLITLLLTLTIVKQLGANESGYYFFIISFLMFLASFSSLGLYNAILKEVSINKHNNEYISNIITKAIILIFMASITISILLYFYNSFSIEFDFVNNIINKYLSIVLISLFPFTLTFLFSNYFQATRNLVLSMILLNLGYQSIMIMVLYIHPIFKARQLLVIFDFSIVFIVILAVILYLFKHKNKFKLTTNKTFYSLLTLSLPMMVSQIVSQINNFSGQFLLSIYTTPSDISLFSVSMRIGILMSFFIMAVNRIVAPKFAILYKNGDMKNLEKVIIFSNRLLILFSLPMLVIIIIFGQEILNLFGNEFKDAYLILLIISLGQFVASISGTVVFLLQMTGSEKVVRNNIIISTLLSLLVGIIIVPSYGIIGAAMMTFLSLVSVNLLSCYKAYNILGINPLKIYNKKG